jgi:hypothetical protein
VLLLALAVAGCVNWSKAQAPTPQAFAPREQVKVWTMGRSSRLQAVRIDGDSISGTPYQTPPSCDSCRVAIPLAEVDSIQTGKSPEAMSMILIIGIPTVVLGFLAVAAAGIGD